VGHWSCKWWRPARQAAGGEWEVKRTYGRA
jgi:hypothetical protein